MIGKKMEYIIFSSKYKQDSNILPFYQTRILIQLISIFFQVLTELSVSNTGLNDWAAANLAHTLECNETIEKLNLSSNCITPKTLAKLLEVIQYSFDVLCFYSTVIILVLLLKVYKLIIYDYIHVLNMNCF